MQIILKIRFAILSSHCDLWLLVNVLKNYAKFIW